MHIVILGAGFSGQRIARFAHDAAARERIPISIAGTRRSTAGCAELNALGIQGLHFDGGVGDGSMGGGCVGQDLSDELLRCTHLLISIAPAREEPLNDPALRAIGPLLQQCPALEWIGYLSTIGVYGNHDGGWVSEQTPPASTQLRSRMRIEAERGWQALAASRQVPISVLRLSGIYGPGRNALRDAVQGRARMLIKAEQVFNRIHVDDIAQACWLAMRKGYDGVLNITDDEPAPPQDVIRLAHQLVDREPPEGIAFETADISPMARSFYSENKRVSNAQSKLALNLQYRFPDYRTALTAMWEQSLWESQRTDL